MMGRVGANMYVLVAQDQLVDQWLAIKVRCCCMMIEDWGGLVPI